MEIDSIPVVGKMNRAINSIVTNFVILGVIFLLLGILIPFYPQILDFLIAALLIVSSAVIFNIAYRIHHTKKKYTKWMDG